MTMNHPNTSLFDASKLKSLILGSLAVVFGLGCSLTSEVQAGDPLDKSSPKIAHGMYRDRGKSSPKIAHGMYRDRGKSSPKIAHGMYRDRGKSSPKIAHGIRNGDSRFNTDRNLFELNTAMLMALELGQWEIAAEIFDELECLNR